MPGSCHCPCGDRWAEARQEPSPRRHPSSVRTCSAPAGTSVRPGRSRLSGPSSASRPSLPHPWAAPRSSRGRSPEHPRPAAELLIPTTTRSRTGRHCTEVWGGRHGTVAAPPSRTACTTASWSVRLSLSEGQDVGLPDIVNQSDAPLNCTATRASPSAQVVCTVRSPVTTPTSSVSTPPRPENTPVVVHDAQLILPASHCRLACATRCRAGLRGRDGPAADQFRNSRNCGALAGRGQRPAVMAATMALTRRAT